MDCHCVGRNNRVLDHKVVVPTGNPLWAGYILAVPQAEFHLLDVEIFMKLYVLILLRHVGEWRHSCTHS